MFTEDITAIVLDPGSLTLRGGYSGEDAPSVVVSSQVGVREEIRSSKQTEQNIDENGNSIDTNNQQETADEGKNDQRIKRYYIGDSKLKIRRDHLEIISTFKDGQVQDWDSFEQLLQDFYENQVKVPSSEYCLLMSESSIHNQKQREKICELAFDQLKVPNFYIIKNSILSCFSSGRSTALVLDSGAFSTYSVPVHDGFVIQKNIVKFEVGGEFLTDRVSDYLIKEKNTKIYPKYNIQFSTDESNKMESYLEFPDTHHSYERFYELQITRDIKEIFCNVDCKGATSNEKQLEKGEYQLPDESESIPEFLHFRGAHHMVLEAINQSENDIKRQLFNNILLTGGNSLLSGFSSRLQNILQEISPPNSKINFIAYPSLKERRYSSWIGGSVLASLGSFQSLWISKQEYQESGEYIVEKKCP